MSNVDLYDLDSCIKCSICTSYCPVARVTDRFAGPKQNGPDLERFRLQGAAVSPSIEYCTNCKNCVIVCPSGVNISAMNCRAKAEYVKAQGVSLRDRMLSRVEAINRLSRIFPLLANLAVSSKVVRRLGEKFAGVSAHMPMPGFSPKTFRYLFNSGKHLHSERKVVYFPGCYVNYTNPGVGLALVSVLEQSGIEVVAGEFGCCGLPMISGGLLDDARTHALKNMKIIEKYADKGYPVITSCPSCSLSIRQEYRELFGLGPQQPGAEVFDIFEYLLLINEKGELNTGYKSFPIRAGYHLPCHLKAAGMGSPSRELLGMIPGCKIIDLDSGCCGLAGSYGFKKEKYPISMAIGRDLFSAINLSGLSNIVTECGMCRLQIYNGTGIWASHPVEFLARAYSGDI